MLLATQRKTPLSTCFTPVTCRMPFGSRVYLHNRGSKYSSQTLCNFSVKASLVPLRSWSITCCPWCWAACGSSPRWCWPQELRWSHTGSERRHPPPLTWTLGGCGTLEELGNKSTTYMHGQIKRTILRIYTSSPKFGHTCFFFDYFLHWWYTLKTSYIWARYFD